MDSPSLRVSSRYPEYSDAVGSYHLTTRLRSGKGNVAFADGHVSLQHTTVETGEIAYFCRKCSPMEGQAN